MKNDFQRVAIVEPGEAAVRFIHAVREFNLEHDTSLLTIAVFTEAERHCTFVREADQAVSLGAPQFCDPGTDQLKDSYLDYGRLEQALKKSQAEAAWVGWGLLSSQPEFAELCRELGILCIGPDANVMRRVCDRISTKKLATAAGIPIVPWSEGAVETLEDAQGHADRLGYPVIVKSALGGLAESNCRVRSSSELEDAFHKTRSDAFEASGSPSIFLEQFLEGAVVLEVDIVADAHGEVWAPVVRSLAGKDNSPEQVYESPASGLSAQQNELARDMATRFARAVSYQNAGTVRFLYRPETQQVMFLDLIPHVSAEHALTECTAGVDLVKLQLEIARGGRLGKQPPHATTHAMQVALHIQETNNHGAPVTGRIERLRIPAGPGLRVDTGVNAGDSIPLNPEMVLARLSASGSTRREARARLARGLSDSIVVLGSSGSNKSLLLEQLDRLDSWIEPGTDRQEDSAGKVDPACRRFADVALLVAAIECHDADLKVEKTQFFASAAALRPKVRNEVGRRVELRHNHQAYSFKVLRIGVQQYRIYAGTTGIDLTLDRVAPFESWLSIGSRRFHIISEAQDTHHRISVNGISHEVDSDNAGLVYAPAPAVVVSVSVKPGDNVEVGDRLVVLEAMKMEMPILASFAGRVRQVITIPNAQVDAGTPLLQIEPAAIPAHDIAEPVVQIGSSFSLDDKDVPRGSCRQSLGELRRLMLGFDIEPVPVTRLLSEWSRNCPADSLELRREENEILSIFVDVCALFSREPMSDDLSGGEAPSAESYFFSYLRMLDARGEGLPEAFLFSLRQALAHYGVQSLDRTSQLEDSLLWICKSYQRVEQQIAAVQGILEQRLQRAKTSTLPDPAFRSLLDRMSSFSNGRFPALSDLAREVRYQYFEQPLFERARRDVFTDAEKHLAALAADPEGPDRQKHLLALVECPQPLLGLFAARFDSADHASRKSMLEVLTLRHYRIRTLLEFHSVIVDDHCYVTTEYDFEGKRLHVITTHADYSTLAETVRATFPLIAAVPADQDVMLDFYVWQQNRLADPEVMQQEIHSTLNHAGFARPIRRIVVATGGAVHGKGTMHIFTYRPSGNSYEEEKFYRDIHPMMGKRLHLWRLSNFNVKRLPSVEDVYLLHAVAKDNPKDERLFACAEVRDLTPVRNASGRVVQLPHLERMFHEALASIRIFQSRRRTQERLYWNRILLYVWPTLTLTPEELHDLAQKLLPATDGLGLEQLIVRGRIPDPQTGVPRDMVVRISTPAGSGLLITYRPANLLQPIHSLSEYEQKVIRMRQRGLIYPYEIIKMLTPSAEDTRAEFPPGDFVEHDLDAESHLVPVDRPYGKNKSNIIVGVIRNFTTKVPEGMTRVVLLGDPGKDLGALAEPECRRIMAALDLASQMKVPLEWFPISAGAKISMESGVENMDWIARVLRRLIEFTQAGGEVNLVINGINVGAQPYWNAEATMLMHTRGILIMTSKAAMVLTGKRALDFSGGISAEDNQGIGGYDRIMGLNGQAQYWARDIGDACRILLQHYDHTYIAPGETFPRRAITSDPIDRNVQLYSHGDSHPGGFSYVGDIFSDETNPGRKKPFDIRKVMMAAVDQDHPTLERWPGMRGGETAVVWDAHLGGFPVCLIGIESRLVPRIGFTPADGPEQWTSGTLFPNSSKKVARAINAASNNRPVVLLANLAGFDGSPESMRKLQLEYGAEIGRAVVNFKGPMIFCVISRYHGGAYVVFSQALNENLRVVALEGTFASVIGGAPAAAVVFAGEVDSRARKDPRLQRLNDAMSTAEGAEKARLRAQWEKLFQVVHSEKLGEVATEFDHIHSVHRALKVGALGAILPPANLRPYLIHAIEDAIQPVTKPEEIEVPVAKPVEAAA